MFKLLIDVFIYLLFYVSCYIIYSLLRQDYTIFILDERNAYPDRICQSYMVYFVFQFPVSAVNQISWMNNICTMRVKVSIGSFQSDMKRYDTNKESRKKIFVEFKVFVVECCVCYFVFVCNCKDNIYLYLCTSLYFKCHT